MCQKLPVGGKVHKKNKYFRGNYMYCSDLQLMKYHPTQVCDLHALALVAYKIVF